MRVKQIGFVKCVNSKMKIDMVIVRDTNVKIMIMIFAAYVMINISDS